MALRQHISMIMPSDSSGGLKLPPEVLDYVLEVLYLHRHAEFFPARQPAYRIHGLPGYTSKDKWRAPRVKHISTGGFNTVWKITLDPINDYPDLSSISFILRIPTRFISMRSSWELNPPRKSELAKPHRQDKTYLSDVKHSILNEVSTLNFIRDSIPLIRVPKVYAFSSCSCLLGLPFIAMELMEGITLHKALPTYTSEQFKEACKNIANTALLPMICKRFSNSGRVELEITYGKGREKKFKEEGPNLEPFALMHGDMHACNILMNGTAVSAVIDWEFADLYPVSELLRRGFGSQKSEWQRRVAKTVLERVGDAAENTV